MRVDVLCQCGWGLLAVPEEEIPGDCPICAYAFNLDAIPFVDEDDVSDSTLLLSELDIY